MGKKGGGGGSAPAAPDPTQSIETQARVNRVNTFTPFGNATYFGPDKENLRIDLSGNQSSILGGQEAIQQGLLQRGNSLANQLPSSPLNFDNLPGYVTGVNTSGLAGSVDIGGAGPVDPSGANSGLSRDLFARARGLLDPVFAEQERGLQQDLANRGLPVGGEAQNRALDRFDRSRNDAYTQAAYDSILPALDVGFKNADLGLRNIDNRFRNASLGYQQADYGFKNAALQNQGRQQGIAERQALRGNQYQELGAILGGSPVQTPQFNPPTPIDVVGPQTAAYQGQLSAYNNAQAGRQSTMGGLLGLAGSLGGAAIMSSDRRLKTEIRRIGTHRTGVGVYRYRYKSGGPLRVGVMAQEVRKVKPQAVVKRDGYLHVNYGVLNEH